MKLFDLCHYDVFISVDLLFSPRQSLLIFGIKTLSLFFGGLTLLFQTYAFALFFRLLFRRRVMFGGSRFRSCLCGRLTAANIETCTIGTGSRSVRCDIRVKSGLIAVSLLYRPLRLFRRRLLLPLELFR